MFTELKLYVAKFNDCNVPATWEENPKLGKWVRINARRSEAGDYRQSARLVSMLLDSSGSADCLPTIPAPSVRLHSFKDVARKNQDIGDSQEYEPASGEHRRWYIKRD